MPKKRVLRPQSIWEVSALEAAFQEHGIKPLHLKLLYRHFIKNPGSTFRDVPNLPQAAIALLEANFVVSSSKVTKKQESEASDGTIKLLVQLQDGFEIETVIMKYDTSITSEDAAQTLSGGTRSTLCVSSQVGCQMGCTFCATGTMGLIANLTTAEILEQLFHAQAAAPIRNVVFMGMGEPLNNYDAVRGAVQLMVDTAVFALAKRQVTVSTVGVVPRILRMAEELPGVSLALSLHAPTQALRSQIVPSATAYGLDKLMAAVWQYQADTGQRVFVEYVMLKDVNDGPEQAGQMGELLAGRDVVVNLIPWNPVYSPDIKFEAPGGERTDAFRDTLREHGVRCTVRQEKGQDISGACGQLVIEHGGKRSERGQSCGVKDIEELRP